MQLTITGISAVVGIMIALNIVWLYEELNVGGEIYLR
jgi:hypothetical protein